MICPLAKIAWSAMPLGSKRFSSTASGSHRRAHPSTSPPGVCCAKSAERSPCATAKRVARCAIARRAIASRHCEACRPISSSRVAHPCVIARRAAPWQSMPLCGGRWIASFLAMTSQGRNHKSGAQQQGGSAPTALPRHCESRSRSVIANRAPLRHCESRRLVSSLRGAQRRGNSCLHVVALQIALLFAMTVLRAIA